ncbi:MAG: TonB-dependent receptor [Nitrospirota bacterium]
MQESIRPSDRWIIDLGVRSEINVNPNLDPLKAYDYETGLEARFEGGHSFDLFLFYMTVKDEIVQTIEPGNISS